MSDLTDHERTSAESGKSVHIGDCEVWAAIYYLDSATDYREYIRQYDAQPSGRLKAKFPPLWLVVLLIPLIFYCLYLADEWY